jgi:O-antigen/teichoic acid export membrane protein
MGGTKAIYTVRLLVLAILLTPADFGLFAIAMAATGFLTNLTNLGLIPALVQSENPDKKTYDSAWTFDVTRAVLVTALTVVFAPLIAVIFNEPLAVPLIQVLAFRALIEALMSIKVAALNRNLLFRPLAFLRIVEAIVNAVISISLAASLGVWAMIIGALGGMLAMVVTSYILAPYRPHLFFSFKTVKPLLKFGWWILAAGIIAMAGSYGIRIIISRELGAADLGLYFLAAQLAFFPSEIASNLVGPVSFPLFARLQSNPEQADRTFQAILTGLMALLFPVCALIFVLSPVVVQDILGAKWHDTVPLIKILTIATVMGLLTDATVPLVKGFGQPHRIALIELVQSSSIIIMNWLFISWFGVLGTAIAWLPTVVFVQILCLSFIKSIFRNPLQNLKKPFIAILASTLCGAGVSALVIAIFPNIVGLVLATFLAVVIIGSILWISDHRFLLGLSQNIATVFPQVTVFLKIRKVENN